MAEPCTHLCGAKTIHQCYPNGNSLKYKLYFELQWLLLLCMDFEFLRSEILLVIIRLVSI